jgi:hypothetical protein
VVSRRSVLVFRSMSASCLPYKAPEIGQGHVTSHIFVSPMNSLLHTRSYKYYTESIMRGITRTIGKRK